MICDCRVFNNYKNSNYEKNKKKSTKIWNIFLQICKPVFLRRLLIYIYTYHIELLYFQ